MPRRLIHFLVRAALLWAVLWLARWALVRWIDGPKEVPSSRPWPPLPGTEDEPAQLAGPARPASEPEPTADLAPAPAPARRPTTSTRPSARSKPASVGRSDDPSGASWVAPEEPGTCPPSHPVKAKLSTRLYREPGTTAYDRATPDRCYASPEAAEAEGFRRAKR